MGAFEEELTGNVKWCLFRNVDDIIQICFYPFLMNRMCHCDISSASVLTHCFLCGFCPNTPSGDICRILLEGIICHEKTVDNVRTLICCVHFFKFVTTRLFLFPGCQILSFSQSCCHLTGTCDIFFSVIIMTHQVIAILSWDS